MNAQSLARKALAVLLLVLSVLTPLRGATFNCDLSQYRRLPGLDADLTNDALLVHWEGRKTLLVAGADDRGLMYALLDTADRIGWAANVANPLSEIRNTVENPAVAQRALSIYTMHRATFEQRFFDEDREAVRPNVQFSFPARCPLSRKYGGNVRRRPFD